MIGVGLFPIKGALRRDGVLTWGGWQCAGAASPTKFFGDCYKGMTVSRTSTGVYVVTVPKGISFPQTPVIMCDSQCVDTSGTNRFFPLLTGAWTNAPTTGSTFTLSLYQDGGTGLIDPPSNAGNLVMFAIFANDSLNT
jgi:hypothetical protein